MNEIICNVCGHSINVHYLDRPSNGPESGYCTHYDNENHVFCNCTNSSSDIAAAAVQSARREANAAIENVRTIAIERGHIITEVLMELIAINNLLANEKLEAVIDRIYELATPAAPAEQDDADWHDEQDTRESVRP